MATTPTLDRHTLPSGGRVRSFIKRLRAGEEAAYLLTLAAAATILLITSLIFYELYVQSALSRHKFGFHFLFTQTWNPVTGDFGALPYVYGTVVTSVLALIIAIPQGLGSAIFLASFLVFWGCTCWCPSFNPVSFRR